MLIAYTPESSLVTHDLKVLEVEREVRLRGQRGQMRSQDKPNILWISTHGTSAWNYGCSGRVNV